MPSPFRFSEKIHYAFVVCSTLAQNYTGNRWYSLQTIAQSYGLSHGYLEQVVASLRRAGLVMAKKGAAGGYRLTRAPQTITYAQIMSAVEGQNNPTPCPHCFFHSTCITQPMIAEFEQALEHHFSHKTLATT